MQADGGKIDACACGQAGQRDAIQKKKRVASGFLQRKLRVGVQRAVVDHHKIILGRVEIGDLGQRGAGAKVLQGKGIGAFAAVAVIARAQMQGVSAAAAVQEIGRLIRPVLVSAPIPCCLQACPGLARVPWQRPSKDCCLIRDEQSP